MTEPSTPDQLRLAVPKGRMQEGVVSLLAEAGITLRQTSRGYRPVASLPDLEVKLLKPQNIVEMLHVGSRDVGFAGADWIAELGADVVELLSTELDPVRLVAAAPAGLLEEGRLPEREVVVASEYERLTQEWMRSKRLRGRFVRSYGATEVFPPEDADIVVDNSATGSTLEANGLVVADVLMHSCTRLYASHQAARNPAKAKRIEHMVMVVRAVLEARRRALIEVNVASERLDELLSVLPCMRQPTVAPLAGSGGYAVKAAVLRQELPQVIPLLKARGGTDILVSAPAQIVP